MAKKATKPPTGMHDPVEEILALARLDFACYVQLMRPELKLARHVLAGLPA